MESNKNSAGAFSDLLAIPKLGIIRARALAKAGWPDTARLRSATEEQLMAVPGITAIKARQILEYLASSKPTVERAIPEVPQSAEEVVEWSPETDLLLQAVRKMTYTVRTALLRAEQGSYEYELYTEMCRWVRRFGEYASDSKRDIERSLNTAGDLVRLRTVFEAALGLDKLPKTVQRQLARGLARCRKQLKRVG